MCSRRHRCKPFCSVISFFSSDLSFKALAETGILESPRKRRRRNSDSNLYCKARGEEIDESEKDPGQTLGGGTQLDLEKRRFVERYLENIHETRSMTTETSDSGVRTHGAPSDFEMQEITGKYDLSFFSFQFRR